MKRNLVLALVCAVILLAAGNLQAGDQKREAKKAEAKPAKVAKALNSDQQKQLAKRKAEIAAKQKAYFAKREAERKEAFKKREAENRMK